MGGHPRNIAVKLFQNLSSCFTMDGWVTFDFTSFLTAFQSYQDDGRVKIKGCVQQDPIYNCKDFRILGVSNPKPPDQQTRASSTGLN